MAVRIVTMVYQLYEDFCLRALPILFNHIFQIHPQHHTDIKLKLELKLKMEFELKSDFKLKPELIENI